MVMTTQGGAFQANTQMGMQVVQTILPPPPVMAEPDDVVMFESGEVSIQSERSQSFTTQRCQESSVIQEDVKPSNAFRAFQSIGSIRYVWGVPSRPEHDAPDSGSFGPHPAERLRAAKEAEDRLKAQHFQTEADFAERLKFQRMQDESERARWVDDVQKSTNMQIATLQQQMREMEAEPSQLRDLRATSAQIQHATVTPVPDTVSQIKTESGIANFQQDAKDQDADSVAVKKEKTTKVPAPKSSDDAKARPKKATSKARASRKLRRGGYPSDSDPSSEDDDSDSSSDDSDSSFCESLSDMTKATQGGTTTTTIRPFVTASSLDDFDEKASLSERTRWWERFQTLAFQGGWSDKMKMSDSEKYYTMKQRKAETPSISYIA
ncbi:LOW QUALITY PROTEIN: hypothetical protein PHMEG_00032006 [Phytophthora megakarya]|uniref:Uncharacterized protein n=1 Tax=Phytophthora megakarya TaxID=4795 RepID=A0A225UWL4_9STRA|nr:LOW QUALITY PROTEIN: hypothetical protein PHMEG_00032006 [Phytophthora megakarya]